MADYQCRQIRYEDYFRLQPLLPYSISLDECQATDDLLALADSIDLDPLLDWIEVNL